MLNFSKLLISFMIFSLIGCSPVVKRSGSTLNRDGIYAIGAFWNYTETPMAGLKASSIVESLLADRGVKVISLIGGVSEIEGSESQDKLIERQRDRALELKAKYLVVGSVQEWRYKTGIDAETCRLATQSR